MFKWIHNDFEIIIYNFFIQTNYIITLKSLKTIFSITNNGRFKNLIREAKWWGIPWLLKKVKIRLLMDKHGWVDIGIDMKNK